MSRIRLVGIVLLLLFVPRAVHAVTVEVAPGDGTLQAAIDAATGHTTFALSSGVYAGPVSITKPDLTIRTHAGAFARIDAGCTASVALDVAAVHFALKGVSSPGALLVTGGTDRELVVAGSSRVKLSRVVVGEDCGAEPFGLEVNASDHVLLSQVTVGGGDATSHIPAATFVDIAANAAVTARTLDADIVLVQDSGAPMLKVGPSLIEPDIWSLRLVNASGLRIISGFFRGDITIDSASDDNEFIDCVLNGGGWTDNGTSNCGAANAHIPAPPCP